MFIKTIATFALATIMSTAIAAPDLRYQFQWRENVNGQVKLLNQFQILTASHTVDHYSATKSVPYNSACINGSEQAIVSAFEVGPQLQLIALGMEANNKVMTDIEYQFTELKDKYKPIKGCAMEFLNAHTLKGKMKVVSELDHPTTVVTSEMDDGREISLVMTVSKTAK